MGKRRAVRSVLTIWSSITLVFLPFTSRVTCWRRISHVWPPTQNVHVFCIDPCSIPHQPFQPIPAGAGVTSKQHNALLVCELSTPRRVMHGTFAMRRRSLI